MEGAWSEKERKEGKEEEEEEKTLHKEASSPSTVPVVCLGGLGQANMDSPARKIT